MTKNTRKIATYCFIGALTLIGPSMKANAEETSIAGIGIALNGFYLNVPNEETSITERLSYLTSEFKDIAVAQVQNYINIRSKASEESEILGKLYNESGATILKEDGGWYKIKSGSVTGYIKSDYVVTGEKVEELADTIGEKLATVTTTTLKVREKASVEASIAALVPIGEELNVVKELDGWVKISNDSDIKGYVSADYVDVRIEFSQAVSIEEEKERLADEEAARKAEEASSRESASTNTVRSKSTSTSSSSSNSSSSNSSSSNSSSSNSSSIRGKIVDYALQFVGNPYVWGGTSLRNGADCSGFTQSVFGDYGIYIPRTSREQASGNGREISIANIRPGDLIFYGRNGSINHVAIYIGNSKVISASSPDTGIRISSYNYRTPYKVMNYID